jgi:hypothetical protein
MNIQSTKDIVVAAANNSQKTRLAFGGRGRICTRNQVAKSPAIFPFFGEQALSQSSGHFFQVCCQGVVFSALMSV